MPTHCPPLLARAVACRAKEQRAKGPLHALMEGLTGKHQRNKARRGSKGPSPLPAPAPAAPVSTTPPTAALSEDGSGSPAPELLPCVPRSGSPFEVCTLWTHARAHTHVHTPPTHPTHMNMHMCTHTCARAYMHVCARVHARTAYGCRTIGLDMCICAGWGVHHRHSLPALLFTRNSPVPSPRSCARRPRHSCSCSCRQPASAAHQEMCSVMGVVLTQPPSTRRLLLLLQLLQRRLLG